MATRDKKSTDTLIAEKHKAHDDAVDLYIRCTRRRIRTEDALTNDKLQPYDKRILEETLAEDLAREKVAEGKAEKLQKMVKELDAEKARYDTEVERFRIRAMGRARDEHEKRRARDREEEVSKLDYEFRAKQRAEETARLAAWKLKCDDGAPATFMLESDERPLRRPTISFVMEAGECLNFGATCKPCKMHTYFWFKQVHGNEAAAKQVNLAEGQWAPTYTFDKSHVKCGKCQANLAQ